MLLAGLLPTLSLATMIGVAAVAAIVLALFLRRRSNRHPLEGREERNIAADLDAGVAPPDHLPPR